MKLREKKINAFGKSIPVIAVIGMVLTAGIAGAVLVSYLSPPVTTTTTVDSPISLKLYDPNCNPISNLTLKGGESLDFFKIAHNDADTGIPFAIALVIQGTDGEGIVVDSAGPKVAPGDTVDKDGVPKAWNYGALWWQNEGEAWYLHDAYNKYNAGWDSINNTWIPGMETHPQNTVYDDGGSVTIGDTDYYIVIFGGTIGTGADGQILASETITNEGWGTPTGYTATPSRGPLVMQPGAYDVGKVRVHFAPNFKGEHTVKMQVVMPGYTVEQIITEMFAT
ncbi:MAG: hypothetical protein JRD89_14330 [Deltaproteobacteria bacterium]|nr:hypothetical protein [Deltaproteobacteria bacterium]